MEERQYKWESMSISEVDFKEDADIVAFCESRWERREEHRANLERQWYENIAQFLGYQYHYYDTSTGMLRLPKAPRGRVRLVANRLAIGPRKNCAKLLRTRPQWETIPASADTEDAHVADIGKRALRYYWRYLEMDEELIAAAMWLFTTGNVFFRTYWDPMKGPEMDMSEEGGEPQIAHLGDLCVESVSPFEVDIDPEATSMKNATHLIHTKLRNKKYLEERYGKKGLLKDAKDEWNLTQYYQRRIQTMSGPFATESKNQDEEENSTLTHTVMVNPTVSFPRGWYAIVAGGRVLAKQPNLPPPLNEIPYSHAKEIHVPGRFWGLSSLESCIPLQSDYNKARSQLIQVRNLMSKPKWFNPQGSGVSETALTEEIGEVIDHAPGLKPEAWHPPEIPQYVIKTIEYTLRDMEDLQSIHEVTQARAPSGVRTGVAINALQEMDDQTLAPTFHSFERALARIGSWALQLLAHNVTEERIIRIVGTSKEVEAMEFIGKSLYGPNAGKPGANYFDVDVQTASGFPTAKGQRQAMVVDLVNSGILNPQTDRSLILRALEIGSEEPIFNTEQMDRQAAMRENRQMIEGMLVAIKPWDDDNIHLDAHTLFEKSPEFSRIASAMPDMIDIFEQHKNQHGMRLQQMQMAMMPPPQMGPPPGPGMGPPPGGPM